MKIREHTELEVYKKAFDAAMRIFELTKRFPKEESRWHRDSDTLTLAMGATDRSMNKPAASCGASDLGDDVYLKCVTPECFNRGSSSEPRLDSRLKHAGMTVSNGQFP